MGPRVDFNARTPHIAPMNKVFTITALLTPLLALPAGAASFNIAGGSSSFTIHGDTSSNRYSSAGGFDIHGSTGGFVINGGTNSFNIQGDTSNFRQGGNTLRVNGAAQSFNNFNRDNRFEMARDGHFRIPGGASSFDISGASSQLRTDGTRRLEVRGSTGRFNTGGSNQLQVRDSSRRLYIYR